MEEFMIVMAQRKVFEVIFGPKSSFTVSKGETSLLFLGNNENG